ncbi:MULTISPECIES: diguanylate phosphodiesterase [Pantoea]|jgi:EAL domain-containing protein (putative c-di-GMP-specific phosphodiesterase class I)|uniref:diguanylate phosphodiesterase n=1 Tax=Pantoea TaxID=53335 RepID=UPI001F319140|nr:MULTISPECIES: diguanylate phosphodiesterase [Pantoea]UIL54983.1 diguanylate phosphodiesterase [Pantoea agglomerans]
MLSTIIYRSQLTSCVSPERLQALVDHASSKNMAIQVTGILLFDGQHFFQVLEGTMEAVLDVYQRISQDDRHFNLIELMRDYAPARRFGHAGMELFDLRGYQDSSVVEALLNRVTLNASRVKGDRVVKFLRSFVEGRDKETFIAIDPAQAWQLVTPPQPALPSPYCPAPDQHCAFALQPIVDVARRRIVSCEALIRGPQGASPADYFARLPEDKIYQADLHSKTYAFMLARHLGMRHQTLSVNLLPMSLVVIEHAVEQLIQQIIRQGLRPEQVVVEVTEDEVISRFDEFQFAVQQLKAAGISLALDDFGAGFAGLSLLAEFQPDKVKIDRKLIMDIHRSGPRQAIVLAILKCCNALEITVIAEGVEKIEEWLWLEGAGVRYFQGFLFARPALNTIPPVSWPERRQLR